MSGIPVLFHSPRSHGCSAGKSADMMLPEGRSAVDGREIQRVNETMAVDGLRVLYIAMRRWDHLPEDMSHGNIEKELTLIVWSA
jgi:Ca2+-transporting ATPase